MISTESAVKTDSEPCPLLGHLAEDAIKQSSPFDPIRTRRKIRGKWVKSNANIGGMKIAEATRLARELTGEDHIDLHLPEWSEICPDWTKYCWMKAEDVVYNRVFCLLCQENVLEPAFGVHMRKKHSEESKDVAEVMKRMTAVRLSRFFSNGIVDKDQLEQVFPAQFIPSIVALLEKGGCIVRQLRESEKERISMDHDRGGRKRSGFRVSDVVDLQRKRHEDSIKGVPLRDAEDMALVLCQDTGALPEVLFAEEISESGASNHTYRFLRRDYCYSCQLNVPGAKFETHFHKDNYRYHQKYNPTPEGAFEVMSRMTEVRTCRFFSANPLPLWKVNSVCNDDEDLICRLIGFLQQRGFVTNLSDVDPFASEWPLPTRFNTPLADFPPLEDEKYDPPSECSSAQTSDSESSSLSYASSRSSSRASSRCSSPGIEGFTNIPYSVLNRIRMDPQIKNYLNEIDFILEQDETFSPSQSQYMFLMGHAMYSLVVSNGCKLNVLNRLLLGDYNAKFMLKNSGLHLLRFRTKGTCLSRPVENWLVVDEETKRAMDLYLRVRNRRSRHLDCEEPMTHSDCGFFISFYMKGMNGNDVDYPLSQFLRMCGVDWKFRAKQLAASVGALILRDLSKINADYAFDFYNKLRVREQSQCEILGSPDSHPIIANMVIEVSVKTRKDKGTIKGPMGPNESTKEKLILNWKRKHPDRDRVAKRFKKLKRQYDEDFPYSVEEEEEGKDEDPFSPCSSSAQSMPPPSTCSTYTITPEPEDVDSVSRASTPVDASPTRPYVSTPPRDTPSAYAATPEPEDADSRSPSSISADSLPTRHFVSMPPNYTSLFCAASSVEELHAVHDGPRELTDLHLL